MADAGDEFWAFSLAFYRRPEVSPACLALQDRHGRDVNLVLYLCWLGLSGRGRLDVADLARAAAAVAPWRESMIEPLRAARRALKGAPGADGVARYEAAKAAELEAERMAQRCLAALAPSPSSRSAETGAVDAAANLAVYLDDDARKTAAPIFAALAAGGH